MYQYRPHERFSLLIGRALVLLFAMFCVIGLFGFVVPALAQDTAAFEQFGEATTLPTDSIAIVIARIIRVALSVVGILFVLLVIYAGFLYLTARGELEPTKKAKKIFQQSIIGLIIIFSAYSITTFILDALMDAVSEGTSSAIADAYAEPLSGSLGAGIIDDHYPERDATDIPRNTRIFVSFKEAINPASIVWGYEDNPDSVDLNTDAVLIYPTQEGPTSALASQDVVVTYDEAYEIFVFDPVDYLGSAQEDMNYTVALTTDLEKADGSSAFTGVYADGYSWTFEVSTDIDVTPPYVVSVIPGQDDVEPRNVTIELTFSEAMDPVASTGSYITSEDSFFTNIEVRNETGEASVEGTFEISNGYTTVSFTPTDACGEDPCGDTIYCLPTNELIGAIGHAATLNEEEAPQAQAVGTTFDGLVDAVGNSLDGNHDGQACGSALDTIACEDGDEDDDYEWTFSTSDEIEDTVPRIIDEGLNPDVRDDEAATTGDVTATFNTYLKSSTVNSDSVSLWPDPYYEFWFSVRKETDETNQRTIVSLEHPALVSTQEGGWDYWPVFTSDIKSSYQICMYPAMGPGKNCKESRSESRPYCCNGIASANACQTETQLDAGNRETLPDNSETQP